MFFLRLACTCEETCKFVWPPSLSPFASSTCVHLRQLAGPFDQGFKPHWTWVISSNSNSRGKALIFYLLIIKHSKQGSYGPWKTWKVLEYYCGIFQDWKVLEKGHWSWKVLEICLTQPKNMKCMEGSKENWHWDLGSVGVNVNFRALEKSIWVLEKSWKFVSVKRYEPWAKSLLSNVLPCLHCNKKHYKRFSTSSFLTIEF